jgi:hypothetical protein
VTTTPGLGNLIGQVAYNNVSQCALVLEDNPVGEDSRLYFDSFPEDGFEESYAVAGYREIASSRMPQPGEVAYRGGNWSAFSLALKFRAGDQLGRRASIDSLSSADLESILLTMQRKVRWCQALAFPLERDATTFNRRVIQRLVRSGASGQALANQVGQLGLVRNDPPFVLVVFGSFLTLRCYVTGYAIKWTHPFHPVTAHPYGAEVTLSFQRLDLDNPTWQSVREQGGKLPQSPFIPRIQGDVLLRVAAGRSKAESITAANARAAAQSRANNPGGAAAAFLSARGQ